MKHYRPFCFAANNGAKHRQFVSRPRLFLTALAIALSAVLVVPGRAAAQAQTSVAQQALQKGHEAFDRKDYSEARSWLSKAADQGDAAAQCFLGTLYEDGLGGPKDEKEAARLYKLSADQGYAAAQTMLGVYSEDGRGGLPKNETEAARFYKLAADQGDAVAQNMLGAYYDNGRGGLPKDDREAARLYKLAADQGYANAQYNLGTFYDNGRGGLPKNESEAARLYKLAADHGKAEAQFNLGIDYETGGGGLAKNDREAARLYKLAADQGIAQAQYNLGVMYEKGIGGQPKNEAEAARLYKLAADQGVAEAQYNLGNFYTNGRGVPKNYDEAARYLKLAADQGYKEAQRNLNILAKRKATTQLAATDDAPSSTDAEAAFQFLQGQINIDVSLTGHPEPGLSRIQTMGGGMCKLRCGFHMAYGVADVIDAEFEFEMADVAPSTLQYEIDGHNRGTFNFSSASGKSVFQKRGRSRKVDVISYEQKPLSDWSKMSEWVKTDKVYCRSKPDKANLARVLRAFALLATACGAHASPF